MVLTILVLEVCLSSLTEMVVRVVPAKDLDDRLEAGLAFVTFGRFVVPG